MCQDYSPAAQYVHCRWHLTTLFSFTFGNPSSSGGIQQTLTLPPQQQDMLQMIAPSGIISSYPPSHLILLVRCPEQAQRRCYQVNVISSAVEVEGFFCVWPRSWHQAAIWCPWTCQAAKGALSRALIPGWLGASWEETERPGESKLPYLVLRLSRTSPGSAACTPACRRCVNSESLSHT